MNDVYQLNGIQMGLIESLPPYQGNVVLISYEYLNPQSLANVV